MMMLSSQEANGGSYGAAARGLPTSLYLKNLPPEVRVGSLSPKFLLKPLPEAAFRAMNVGHHRRHLVQ